MASKGSKIPDALKPYRNELVGDFIKNKKTKKLAEEHGFPEPKVGKPNVERSLLLSKTVRQYLEERVDDEEEEGNDNKEEEETTKTTAYAEEPTEEKRKRDEKAAKKAAKKAKKQHQGGAEGALKDAVIDLCSDAMKHARLVLTQVSNQAAATAENLANRDVVMTDTDATVHLLKTTIIELLDALLDDTLEKEKIKNLKDKLMTGN